jgi:hypothetical protein
VADKRPLRKPRGRWIEKFHAIGVVPKEKKPEVRNEIVTTLAPVLDAEASTLLCSWQHR